MQVTSHLPRVSRIVTFDDAETPFHSIRHPGRGRDRRSEWDAIVAKVDEYRAGRGGAGQ